MLRTEPRPLCLLGHFSNPSAPSGHGRCFLGLQPLFVSRFSGGSLHARFPLFLSDTCRPGQVTGSLGHLPGCPSGLVHLSPPTRQSTGFFFVPVSGSFYRVYPGSFARFSSFTDHLNEFTESYLIFQKPHSSVPALDP